MKRLCYDHSGFEKSLAALYGRPAYPPEAEKAANEVISAISERGDEAVAEYAAKFDKVNLKPSEFRLSKEEIDDIASDCSRDNRRAIKRALENIRDFALRTKPRSWTGSPRPGVMVGEKFTPMRRVGAYIPGGTAPLVSTVLHTAGIAAAAGVEEIVAATPPNGVHPETIYAMKQAGVTEIYRLGGIYAIAAMAVGTETISPVEKIVGPGNAYVTAAKKLLFGKVSIDLVAGPSEIMVIADGRANPAFVAADLLSQAEHGSGLEQAVLVSDSTKLLNAVEKELERQKAVLPRLATVDRVVENGMFFIKTKDLEQACKIAGDYAPEHLEIQTEDPDKYAKLVSAAGAIFLADWTPESCGDFSAGPSHVLPTAGSAKSFSGLSTSAFMRRSSIVKYSRTALQREIDIIEHFGAMERLAAHGFAGTVRKSNGK
ncbi:MAG: histidinol dehydrogenase [Victivallaceae bacterium]|nr:histidinol dehydrogenase [Victivallaceae bacterium]